jgi:hypothetical protein
LKKPVSNRLFAERKGRLQTGRKSTQDAFHDARPMRRSAARKPKPPRGPTHGWARKIRRKDRTARVREEPFVADFKAEHDRGAARATLIGTEPDGLRFAIEVRYAGMPADLKIIPETRSSLAWQRLVGPDAQTGDADFDAFANITGPPAWVAAAMTSKTRNQVRTVLQKGGSIEDGRIRVELVVRRPHPLVTQVHDLLRLGKRLSLPDSEVTRMLVSRAVHSQRTDVRATLVKQLIKFAPLVEHYRTFVKLDRFLADGDARAQQQATALRLAWLKGEPRRVRQFPEPAVLELLDASKPIRLAAIERLGVIGTANAIAPLTATARGFFTSSSIKRAAKAALQQVIERVGHVEAGGLALTQEDGRLSLD